MGKKSILKVVIFIVYALVNVYVWEVSREKLSGIRQYIVVAIFAFIMYEIVLKINNKCL